MAQSGYTPIVLYNSTTAGHVPTTGNLQTGELAINVTDGKLYFNQAGTITAIATTVSAAGYASNLLGGGANRLVYQTGTNTTSFLAAPSVAGTALVWNGSALTYGNPSFAGNVTGTVAVANGGTSSTSLAANNVLLGNGTSALQTVAPGASGNGLISNGSTWVSSPFPIITVVYDGQISYNSTSSFSINPNKTTVFFVNTGNGYGGNAYLYLGVEWGPGGLYNNYQFFASGVDYQVTFAGALMQSLAPGNGSVLQIQPYGNYIGGYGAPSDAKCLVMQF